MARRGSRGGWRGGARGGGRGAGRGGVGGRGGWRGGRGGAGYARGGLGTGFGSAARAGTVAVGRILGAGNGTTAALIHQLIPFDDGGAIATATAAAAARAVHGGLSLIRPQLRSLKHVLPKRLAVRRLYRCQWRGCNALCANVVWHLLREHGLAHPAAAAPPSTSVPRVPPQGDQGDPENDAAGSDSNDDDDETRAHDAELLRRAVYVCQWGDCAESHQRFESRLELQAHSHGHCKSIRPVEIVTRAANVTQESLSVDKAAAAHPTNGESNSSEAVAPANPPALSTASAMQIDAAPTPATASAASSEMMQQDPDARVVLVRPPREADDTPFESVEYTDLSVLLDDSTPLTGEVVWAFSPFKHIDHWPAKILNPHEYTGFAPPVTSASFGALLVYVFGINRFQWLTEDYILPLEEYWRTLVAPANYSFQFRLALMQALAGSRHPFYFGRIVGSRKVTTPIVASVAKAVPADLKVSLHSASSSTSSMPDPDDELQIDSITIPGPTLANTVPLYALNAISREYLVTWKHTRFASWEPARLLSCSWIVDYEADFPEEFRSRESLKIHQITDRATLPEIVSRLATDDASGVLLEASTMASNVRAEIAAAIAAAAAAEASSEATAVNVSSLDSGAGSKRDSPEDASSNRNRAARLRDDDYSIRADEAEDEDEEEEVHQDEEEEDSDVYEEEDDDDDDYRGSRRPARDRGRGRGRGAYRRDFEGY
ncbi:hypothetical protein CAOG_04971 [Capsaspora owczarzaki ATCC 30864]|nr:hypothetical protein CAOG_04971 [Capsaspora owczarzaki ATCC 30864]|eukprot:XP_004346656.2 hypothetical protein CAOG_04971 [Capsaspora owczarzaki ATCC 30864]